MFGEKVCPHQAQVIIDLLSPVVCVRAPSEGWTLCTASPSRYRPPTAVDASEGAQTPIAAATCCQLVSRWLSSRRRYTVVTARLE